MKLAVTSLVALVTGFIALSYEIVWYRVFAFATWGQATTFGLLLFFFLGGVAVGSRRIVVLCDAKARADDGREVTRLALLVGLGNLVAFLVVPGLSLLSPIHPILPLVLVAAASGLMGATLPLACHYGIRSDRHAGANLSYVYLANIIGSTAGSYLTGFVLLDVLSTRALTMVLLLLGTAVALALLGMGRGAPGRARAAGGLAAMLITCIALGPLFFARLYERMLYRRYDAPPLAYVRENRHGVVAVTADGYVFGGGAYDGAFNTSLVDDKNAIERAYAVSAMHPAARRVLMIGLSSGSWGQVIANLRDTQTLTIVEINPGYLDLIPLYPAVASLLTNPRVAIEVDDGRRWLLRHPAVTFDMVVMNTTFHWRGHTANLLSVEFLELVRKHLLPGGIVYYNSTHSPEVQRTAAVTFPYALRFMGFVAASDAPFTFDPGRWRNALLETVIDGRRTLDTKDPGQALRLEQLLAITTEGTPENEALEDRASILRRTEGLRVVTDDNMACEFAHPLSFPDAPVELAARK